MATGVGIDPARIAQLTERGRLLYGFVPYDVARAAELGIENFFAEVLPQDCGLILADR